MLSKDELERMTVPQIKEQLKNKKLPTSGAKSELVNRLYEGILAEERLLEVPTNDFDISNVNVDEVLGLDPSDILSSSPSEKFDLSALDDSPPKKTSVEFTNSGLQNQESLEQTNERERSPMADMEKISKNSEAKLDETTQEKLVQLKMAARLGLPIAEAEMKTKRKNRFTIPSTNDDVLNKRAHRFGIEGSSSTASDEDRAKSMRAARFGADSLDDIMTKRAKRFGDDASDFSRSGTLHSDNEKLLARTRRFAS